MSTFTGESWNVGGEVAYNFYQDGSLQMEGELVNGLREGPWAYWRPDGTVNDSWTGTYESDVKISDG